MDTNIDHPTRIHLLDGSTIEVDRPFSDVQSALGGSAWTVLTTREGRTVSIRLEAVSYLERLEP